MHFIGIKWDNKLKTPYIKYKDQPYDIEEKYLAIERGQDLTIVVEKERYCIGSFESLNYLRVPCPNNVKFEKETELQCGLCRMRDSKYFLPLNTLNYEQINLLKKQPHLNYINLFGGNIVKTGVAAKVRKFTRILEQGAIATIFFTDTDGYVARIIESLISKNLSIRQAVIWDTKIKNLNNISTDPDAHTELGKIFKQIKDIFPSTYKHIMLSEPEYYFNFDYYGLKIPDNLSSIKLFNKFSPADVISGVVYGIYGEILFVKDKLRKEIYGVNIKSLLGHTISVSHRRSLLEVRNSPKIVQVSPIEYQNLTLF